MGIIFILAIIGAIWYLSRLSNKIQAHHLYIKEFEEEIKKLKQQINLLLEASAEKSNESGQITDLPEIVVHNAPRVAEKQDLEQKQSEEYFKEDEFEEKSIAEELGSEEEKIEIEKPGIQEVEEHILDKIFGKLEIDWEKFTGVRLFAWLGGFALFLGMIFFVKYTIDLGLITPLIRIILSGILGACLIICGLRLNLQKYFYTIQALCASGLAIFYANIYASYNFYNFINTSTAFILMIFVTIFAFILSEHINAFYIALLGIIGGYLTPVLLSTGVDRSLVLFIYIAFLNIGAGIIALRHKWELLVFLSLLGTLFIETGWIINFFNVSKAKTGLNVFTGFALLYFIIYQFNRKSNLQDKWVCLTVSIKAFVAILFIFFLLMFPAIATQSILLFSYLFFISAICVYLVYQDKIFNYLYLLSGAGVFFILVIWTNNYVSEQLIFQALIFDFIFAFLYSITPIFLIRKYPEIKTWWIGYFYPVFIIGIMFIPLIKEISSFIVWPFIFILNILGLFISIIAGWLWITAGIMIFTFIGAGIWLDKCALTVLPIDFIFIVSVFGAIFFIFSLWWTKVYEKSRFLNEIQQIHKNNKPDINILNLYENDALKYLPLISCVLPFSLLMLLCVKIELPNPNYLFGAGFILCSMLLVMTRITKIEIVSGIEVLSIFLLELLWHNLYFKADNPYFPLLWYIIFFIINIGFPFIFIKPFQDRKIIFAVAGIAGLLQFYIIYKAVKAGFSDDYIGALPLIFALIYLAGLQAINKQISKENKSKITLISVFAGIALFFISIIFPIQFEKQWITIGWAIESVALLLLFHKLKHNGLKYWAIGLLLLSFIRLSFNTEIFSYYTSTNLPILNWYLYTYSIVIICFCASAKLFKPPDNVIMGYNILPALYSMAGILGFILLNIEIADYYSVGTTIKFYFNASLAQDMTYSICWGLYGFMIFIIGISKNIRGARIAGLGLLSVTAFKVFLHDLWRLGQLYRVGSFIGLAIILILVSFLYQKFIKVTNKN